MKRILVAILLFTGSFGFSQITKADVEEMLSINGTSMDKIEEVWIGNRMAFYTDGSSKRTDARYTASNGNKFILTDRGIRADWSKDAESSSLFWPFTSMKYISVDKKSISIHLAD